MQTKRNQSRKNKTHSRQKRPSHCSLHVQTGLESTNSIQNFANAFFYHTTEGILITDSNHTVLKINPGFTTITGYDEESILGKKPSILKSNRHNAAFYHEMFEKLSHLGKWQGEIWNRRKNGEIYLQQLSIVSIYDKDKICYYMGLFTDITHYINNNIQVQNHAYYDMLTNLPNRILLHDRLNFMISHAKRNKANMAILLLDLNRFKMINDTLGFSAGDSLLQTIANRLKSCLRDVDGVFRLGDDEFAIILEEIAQPQDAARVAKRLLAVSSLPFQFSNHELYVTVSIGISIFPTDGEEIEVLLKNAEAAMNRAKELGINNYQHYMPTMNSRAFEQLTLEHNLRKALQKDEFIVYYQPQIDLKTQKIFGAEALVRWKHPELGMISPAQFIPIAEETGMILPLGEWVLKTACQQVKKWYDQTGCNFYISVNLSSRQFQQQDLVLTIDRVLQETSLPAHYLELEITETLGMKNPELTLKTLHELKSMGIRIAIDDFGTGYSSLSYLKKFPIDTLKIDRSFVSDIQVDSNDAAIVAAIIALAHSLKLKVIAEGVETFEQANYLLDHGCESIQGFLFSPPVSASDFEIIFRRNLLPDQ
ncbi:MAG TPA: EAL domain-containing protein [Chitinispirillaceae bacterium]|nr:EAL domain-containing protein [Chitinispirillaceae bacterium]